MYVIRAAMENIQNLKIGTNQVPRYIKYYMYRREKGLGLVCLTAQVHREKLLKKFKVAVAYSYMHNPSNFSASSRVWEKGAERERERERERESEREREMEGSGEEGSRRE